MDFFGKKGFNLERNSLHDKYNWIKGNRMLENDNFFDKSYVDHMTDKENPITTRYQGYRRNVDSKDGYMRSFFSYERFEYDPFAK